MSNLLFLSLGAVQSSPADGISEVSQRWLVGIFLVLFIGGLILFVASLLMESLKPKRWLSVLALSLAAVFGVNIDSTDDGGAGSLFDTIGSSLSNGWEKIISDTGDTD